MVAQLHLALVMATDARLLVLDEPTLGLDLLYRKQVFDTLLNDYFDHSRTIVVSTHQVDEVEHILTDVVFLDRGRVVLAAAMDELEHRYHEVVVTPDRLVAARELGPICERRLLGRSILLFERNDPERLVTLGEVRRPGLADLFVATVGARGAAEHKDVAA
jgi:ABC-2 type transport system ATP-binding protein